MKEESLLLLSDLQKLINQVVLIDYTIIILGGFIMKANLKKLISNANIKMLSSFATFALVITTVASNQRCWYVLHEEKLPENAKKLRKF